MCVCCCRSRNGVFERIKKTFRLQLINHHTVRDLIHKTVDFRGGHRVNNGVKKSKITASEISSFAFNVYIGWLKLCVSGGFIQVAKLNPHLWQRGILKLERLYCGDTLKNGVGSERLRNYRVLLSAWCCSSLFVVTWVVFAISAVIILVYQDRAVGS